MESAGNRLFSGSFPVKTMLSGDFPGFKRLVVNQITTKERFDTFFEICVFSGGLKTDGRENHH